MSDLWAQRIYVWLAILNANMGLGTNTKKRREIRACCLSHVPGLRTCLLSKDKQRSKPTPICMYSTPC